MPSIWSIQKVGSLNRVDKDYVWESDNFVSFFSPTAPRIWLSSSRRHLRRPQSSGAWWGKTKTNILIYFFNIRDFVSFQTFSQQWTMSDESIFFSEMPVQMGLFNVPPGKKFSIRYAQCAERSNKFFKSGMNRNKAQKRSTSTLIQATPRHLRPLPHQDDTLRHIPGELLMLLQGKLYSLFQNKKNFSVHS